MKKISYKIANCFVENEIIEKEKSEIFAYGLELMMITVFDILAILILSLFLHCFLETVIYLLAFIPLRIYTGGYHADSALRCFLIFLCSFILFVVLIAVIPAGCYIYIEALIAVIGLIAVFLLAPIENSNKPLGKTEILFYKKISRIIVIVHTLIIVTFMFINRTSLLLWAFSLGEFSVVLAMSCALIKEYIKGRSNNDEKVFRQS